MENKQTAVKWFEQQLDNLDIEIPQTIFEQAKEMEKQQIIDACSHGFFDSWDNPTYKEVQPYAGAEQYYNQTFNQ
jgi:hypothetical protein